MDYLDDPPLPSEAAQDSVKLRRVRLITVLFASATLLGAFLIFLVQPLVGKRLLPWFGGGPGVWMMCLMFYQSALFIGYAYADGLVRWVNPRRQWLVHGTIVGLSFALLPVLPDEAWRPVGDADPTYTIFLILLAHVALPFVALSATGPLLQAWFARLQPGISPYPLYAVSNVGSMFAVFFFPLVIESNWTIGAASNLWSAGFFCATVFIIVCGAMASGGVKREEVSLSRVDPHGRALTLDRVVLWLVLPGCAVILLNAITNKLCLDIASIPFLWVLPLGLYLLSFIIAFSSEGAYRRWLYMGVPLILGIFLYVASLLERIPGVGALSNEGVTWVLISFFSLALFGMCTVLHGELFRLRPATNLLTRFYLTVSLGGALGGIFVGLVAPRIFPVYYEVSFGVALAVLLGLYCMARDPDSWFFVGKKRRRATSLGILASVVLIQNCSQVLREPEPTLHRERNFFGVVRVKDRSVIGQEHPVRFLQHGSTIHGSQSLSPDLRHLPLSYYSAISGIGVLLDNRSDVKPLNLGVVGLGVGTLATYGEEGDRVRFYEIDPAIIRIAESSGYFSFLQDSPAEVTVVKGDARLSLQRELDETGPGNFDVLVVDAFSSDSIPSHLMTVEAFTLFKDHLGPDGVLAVHASARHFDLLPILYQIGEYLDLATLTIESAPGGDGAGQAPARWVFFSPEETRMDTLSKSAQNKNASLSAQGSRSSLTSFQPHRLSYREAPLWTDDYSSLFQVLGIRVPE